MIVKYTPNNKEELIILGKQYDDRFETKYLNEKNDIYLYILESKIVGFLIVEETIDEHNIVLIYVDKNYRQKNIATMLMDYFISTLNVDKPRVLLEVSNNNVIAISLYQKFGFEKIGIRPKYYKDGTDAILMERKIINE